MSVSAVIPVELRQPCASSLAVICGSSPLGGRTSRRLNSARFDAVSEYVVPKLGGATKLIGNSFSCIHPLQGAAFRKGFVAKLSDSLVQ